MHVLIFHLQGKKLTVTLFFAIRINFCVELGQLYTYSVRFSNTQLMVTIFRSLLNYNLVQVNSAPVYIDIAQGGVSKAIRITNSLWIAVLNFI